MAQNFFLACEGFNRSTASSLICSINAQPGGLEWASLQPIFFFIGWVLLIIGWLYTNHTNNIRESRKELKASLDSLNKDIIELKEKALTYYVTPIKGSQQLSFEIVTAQHRIVSSIEYLQRKHPDVKLAAKEKIEDFMDVITGGDFDSYLRKVRSYSQQRDHRLLSICHQSVELCNAVDADFDSIVENMGDWSKKVKRLFSRTKPPATIKTA